MRHGRARPKDWRQDRRSMRRRATLLLDDLGETHSDPRPLTRGDCIDAPRPCPWVSCRYHLWSDVPRVARPGVVMVSFPDLEPWEIPETCALDAASLEGLALDEVGMRMNLTAERVRQIELRALRRIKRRMEGY